MVYVACCFYSVPEESEARGYGLYKGRLLQLVTRSITGLETRCSDFRCNALYHVVLDVETDFYLCSVFLNWEFLERSMRNLS